MHCKLTACCGNPCLSPCLACRLNGELASNGSKLLQRICRVVAVTLPAQERLPVRHALRALLARLPADVLAARCIRPVQRYIDACVQQGLDAMRVQVRRQGPRRAAGRVEQQQQVPGLPCLLSGAHLLLPLPRWQVLGAGVLLDVLRQANEEAGGIVPFTGACGAVRGDGLLSGGTGLQAAMPVCRRPPPTHPAPEPCRVLQPLAERGRQPAGRVRAVAPEQRQHRAVQPVPGQLGLGLSWLHSRAGPVASEIKQSWQPHLAPPPTQMPYLLTPEAKSRILHGEAAMEQQQHLSAAATQARGQGSRGQAKPCKLHNCSGQLPLPPCASPACQHAARMRPSRCRCTPACLLCSPRRRCSRACRRPRLLSCPSKCGAAMWWRMR